MRQSERIERIEKLRKLVGHYKKARKSAELTPVEKETYRGYLEELERLRRIEAGFTSIMTFGQTYFSGDPPHDLLKKATPSPPFHYELCDKLRAVATNPGRVEEAVCAPRGSAKSTWVTNIFVLWVIAYAEDLHNRYWIILMDSSSNAKKQLSVVKMELEANEIFRGDFGDLVGTSKWNTDEITTKNNVMIEAAGITEGIRGTRFGSERPSLICDDLESVESTDRPERIDKMVDLFDKTILPLGDPNLSKVFLIGTLLHYSSLLAQVMKRGQWGKSKYQSIIKFPLRMDLWSTWEEIYKNRNEGETPEDASTIAYKKSVVFYQANKEVMDEGAELLWPERYSLLYLMTLRATNRLSFNSEYQNSPIDEATRLFRTIHYYKVEDINLSELEIVYSLDPSLGASKRADRSAIIVLGRDKRGIMYVLEADVKRRHPDVIEHDLFAKARRYKFKDGVVESVGFQQYFRENLMKHSAELGIYIPAREGQPKNKAKEARIESIEPDVSNGYVRFLASQLDLIDELLYYPKAATDDAVDALQMAIELSKNRSRSLVFGLLN